MGRIRPFVEDDIPAVADLYTRSFLTGDDLVSPPTVRRYFGEVFFRNPWYDSELPSLVYEEREGKVVGFLGVVPRRMRMSGQPIRVATPFHFMVEPDSRFTLAGVELLRAFFSGPQDLSLSDGGTPVGRKMWEGLGGTTALLHSLRWTRLLRPLRYLASRAQRTALAPLAFVSRPFCNALDALAVRIPGSRFHQVRQSAEEELDENTLREHLAAFCDEDVLQPDYDELSLKWLLEVAARNHRRGQFRKIVVRNRERAVLGWYLYYLNPGGVSETVQIAARKDAKALVLDHLFYHAWRRGAGAVSGRLQPRLLCELATRRCVFQGGGSWVLVHSKNSELLHAIHRGDAFLTRLEGEWCITPQAFVS